MSAVSNNTFIWGTTRLVQGSRRLGKPYPAVGVGWL